MATLADLLRDKQFRSDVGDNARDFFQSASNTAASNVTAPVDGLAWLLRKAGVNVPQAPIGGSDWAQNAGLMAEPKNKNSLASLLGDAAGNIAPILGYAKAPQIAKTLLNIGENSAQKISQSFRLNGRIGGPTPLQQRSFHDDYPGSIGSNAGGQLSHDIDGNPIAAKYIAGRRVGGGIDEPLTPGQIEKIASSLGVQTRTAGSKELGTDLGKFKASVGKNGDALREIILKHNLPNDQVPHVFAHEVGHLIDSLTFGGSIPQAGAKREMQQVYSDLNSAMYVQKGKIGATPESLGYSSKEAPFEINAESIRAYMRDPNYFKSVAPNAAKRIREYVNQNQNLKDVIQFNSGVGLIGVGAYDKDAP